MLTDALDVEDAEQRLSRLQNTFQKLNATSSTTSSKPLSKPDFSFLNKDAAAFSRPQYIEPPKELLSRVHAFLPAIHASNALLASQDQEKIDIEHVDGRADHYIEMNLGLGLFDVRGSTASMPMPISTISPMSSSTSSSYSSTSSSSDDTDSDSESEAEIITSFVPIRPTKPLPRRAIRRTQPPIVMLDQPAVMSNPGTKNGEEG